MEKSVSEIKHEREMCMKGRDGERVNIEDKLRKREGDREGVLKSESDREGKDCGG